MNEMGIHSLQINSTFAHPHHHSPTTKYFTHFQNPVFKTSSSLSTVEAPTITHPNNNPPSPFQQKTTHPAWTSAPHQSWEGGLHVQGQLPSWLKGTYIRNGPGIWEIGDHQFKHLFDGYATLVRLSFTGGGEITAGHRQLLSQAYLTATKTKKLTFREFSEVPKGFFFSKLLSLISGTSLTDNANTGVLRLGDGRVICFTETVKGSIEIDPESLETKGRFKYEDSVGGIIHSAHPMVDKSEFITLLPDLVRPGYVVARMGAGSNRREVVGRVDCLGGQAPGWVHSFALTENYVVVPEMSLRYSVKNLLKEEETPFFKFQWCPDSKPFFHIMCRKTGRLVTSVEVPLYITFHFINAYEEQGTIIADCCEHNGDPSILKMLRLENLRSFSGEDTLPDARIGRFRIPIDGGGKGELEDAIDPEEHGRGMDMCSINPSNLGKKYRFAYACGARRPCNFPNTLTKIDLVEKKAKNWYEDGGIPSEPFFVARPGSTLEDDGVVISLISQKNGGGYALILDALTFKEIARAKLPYGLPYGLHGCWIPNN